MTVYVYCADCEDEVSAHRSDCCGVVRPDCVLSPVTEAGITEWYCRDSVGDRCGAGE